MYIVQGISISFFQSQELDNSSQNRLIQIMCHGKISQLVEIGQECLYVLSARSCFLIGNGKCKQLSNWLQLELSTADRVIPISALCKFYRGPVVYFRLCILDIWGFSGQKGGRAVKIIQIDIEILKIAFDFLIVCPSTLDLGLEIGD